MATAFSAMLGGEILSYVRDAVTDVAVKKRSYFEQSAAVGGVPLNSAELAELVALDAAASMIQFAVSAGQDARAKGMPTPEWVLKMAAEARSALAVTED
jgi:hypothetical protein